jgi:hypothetical protein
VGMDLSRRVCLGLMIVDVLLSHLAFTFRGTTQPYMGRA